jgi:integrase
MPEKRVSVWVQQFKDRPHLMLQWLDPESGRRKSKSAGTACPKEAEAARVDLEADLNAGRYQEASRLSWERFRELFEAEYVAGFRPNTRRNHRDTLDCFEQVSNPGTLRGISERTLSQFVAGMRQLPVRGGKVGLAPGTIKVRLEFLHTALAWAVEQKLLPAVPRFPPVKVPEKAPRPVPAESFEKLLAKAPDAMTRAYLLAGWLAGLRRSEAYALEWDETHEAPYLDLARNRVVLPAEYVKAGRDQWVPLDPALRQALEQLPRQGPQVFRFEGPSGRPVTAATVSYRIRRLARKAGVKLTMHTLRKGFGCRYAGRVPAQVLQKLMRHANIKTTMSYYANVDEAVEAAVLEFRNGQCNSGPEAAGAAGRPEGVSPSPDTLHDLG